MRAPVVLRNTSSTSPTRYAQGRRPRAPVVWVTSIATDAQNPSSVAVTTRPPKYRLHRPPKGRNSTTLNTTCRNTKLRSSERSPLAR